MDLIKNISFKTLIPFVLAFIAILAFHFSNDLTTGDYKNFYFCAYGYYEGGDVFSYLQWRYATWTSRLLIEFFIFWFVQFPTWVFSIVNSSIILAIIAMTYMLFSRKKGFLYATIAIVLSFFYRISDQGSAGYLITMIVYLWPLSAFIATLFPFKKSLEDGDEPKWPAYALSSACALFCCNNEQVCVTSIMSWGMIVIYSYLQNKRINKLYCILLGIAFAHILFILTCPGNSSRTLAEMSHIPTFEHYSFARKIALCIGSPVVKYMIFLWQSFIVWAFSIILPITLFIKNKKAFAPLLVSLIPFLLLLSAQVNFNPVFSVIHEASSSDLKFICITSIAFYASIFFTLYYIGKDEDSIISKYGPFFIFFVGFTTRACLGVTTSFLEMERTFFILEYSMIVVSILFTTKLISQLISKAKTKNV